MEYTQTFGGKDSETGYSLICDLSLQLSAAAAGWPGWPPRLRPLPLRRSCGLNSGPTLEGGLDDLRELRPMRTRRLASTIAKKVNRAIIGSIYSWWAWCNRRTATGVASHSAYESPAVVPIQQPISAWVANGNQAAVKGLVKIKFSERFTDPWLARYWRSG